MAKNITLGLDVSMNSTGWAVLTVENRIPILVASGVVKANTKASHGLRLSNQRNVFEEITDKYQPTDIAKEAGFARHMKATQVLYKAYGVTEEFFAEQGIADYPATTIKKTVTGNGNAEKSSVEYFVRERLALPDAFKFKTDDESDAMAVALTHLIKKGEID